jgi:zinc transport system substrate-binding protein
VDLLRPDAAVLRVEEVDDSPTREAAPVTGVPQLGDGAIRPGSLAHKKMITVIVTHSMRIIPVMALVAALVAGCGTGSGAKGKTTVVAAFYPLAWVAEQVGGPKAVVRNLTPAGAEPHDIELTPRDVGRLQEADVVLYLSHGFQPAVEQAVDGAKGKRVDVLAGLGLRKGVGDEAGKSDPHVWLDPVLFARIVRRIGAVFGEPGHARLLVSRLRSLDRDYRRGLARCARRDFVTSHAAFGYLAARYHLHQIPITGIDPESEPSPQRLQRLIALVRREHVTTVFFERLVSPRLAETVARDAGARAAVLDPIEGLTASEQARGYSYFTLMGENLRQLRSALGCR